MKRAVCVVVLVGLCLALAPSLAEAQATQPQPPGVMLPPMGGAGGQAKPGAVVLSVVMPGTGEWLNRGFEGSFPITECILGYVCCFVQMSSALDAAAGDRAQNKIRIDFWSKPIPEQ